MEEQYVDDVTGPDADGRWSADWAASGAAGLSGRPGRPPLPVPGGLVGGVLEIAAEIAELSAALGRRVDLDGLALLGERAAIAGFSRRGDISCGGASRILATRDGWIALTLAREHDVASMPAWLERSDLPRDITDLWSEIARLVARRSTVELDERAALLGLPCAAVDPSPREPARHDPVNLTTAGSRRLPPRTRLDDVLVLDLSSLWAGPLCADLLGRAGCRIVKVESTDRPDGARSGPADFYDLLHGGHESVALDFGSETDRGALRALIGRADVVIEASRPRAFAALGLDRGSVLGPSVWLSITAHGRVGEDAGRVGFGDDAAAAGGLVTNDVDGLCFCCDAVADPLTGMVAARSVLRALAGDGRWFADIALSRVAASMANGALVSVDPSGVAAPRARAVESPAPTLGAHTESVLREFGIRR